MTGRPCGHVVGEDVSSRRSISQRIFSSASGVLIFMAARQASEAATSSRKVARVEPRFSASTVSKTSASMLRASPAGKSAGTALIATVRPESRINAKP